MTEPNPYFTYEEALATLPKVRTLTAFAVRQIEAICNRVKSREEMEARKDELEAAINCLMDEWMTEIAALGCEVKGPWLVDWDSGDGYYCWRYPEETIAFFHAYDEGFDGRLPVN